jgi:type I restriction enzyme, S subunit
VTTRDGWQRVRFGDVVRNVSESVVDPVSAGLERAVGMEHLEPGELEVTRWAPTSDGLTFTRRFRAGQVLFGRRRAYQRKVAVADFTGVCSGDIYVLEPSGEQLIDELLPFIVQSEPFFQYALRTSAGSLSPRTKWTDLKNYEFDLPPIIEQREVAGVLRAADEYRRRCRQLVARAEDAYNVLLDEAFADMAANEANLALLSDVTTKIVDGVHKTPTYVEKGIPFLTVENLTRGRGIDFTRTRFVTEVDHREFIKRAHPQFGDVLVSKDGTLGVARVVDDDREFSIFVSVALLKPALDRVDPWYLRAYFDSSLFKKALASKTSGSALKHIHLIDFRNARVPVPDLVAQAAVVRRLEIADAAVLCASRSFRAATALLKALTSELIWSATDVQ